MANPLERLRLKLLFGRQVLDAADQMWDAVQRGIAFEVPISFNTQDKTMRAVYVLQCLHKEVNVFMRQSRTLIISKHEKGSHGISGEVHDALKVGGQLADFNKFTSDITKMMQQNETFLRSQQLDPEEMERKSKEEEMAKHAMSTTAEGAAKASQLTSVLEDTGPDSRLEAQRAALKRESLLVGIDGRPLTVEDKEPSP